ncbi:hypothetical protein U8527_17385 [Kordia algicida OT-1]|uniref:Uncharacterized protein n=1 Tax=Kordia algicida OT-1 TaxID=391587 RepID=A9E344_9FLAO|nr:hypothetical protein [Kordia algicida]EDP95464.1 hypothetical protein KAOT1_11091 [Kordia algicida OT-1]
MAKRIPSEKTCRFDILLWRNDDKMTFLYRFVRHSGAKRTKLAVVNFIRIV